MASWYTLHKTRFPALGYANCGAGLWRFVALDDDPEGERCTVIGPHYKTKAELLADLTRYAQVAGYDGSATPKIPPQVWVATIHHRHGTNVYVAMTETGIKNQVAEYCRERWDETRGYMDNTFPVEPPLNDNEVIESYFAALAGDEDVEIGQARLYD